MNNEHSNCAACPFKAGDKLCRNIKGKSLPFCPSKDEDSLLKKSLKEYEKSDIHEFAKQSAVQEGEGYIHAETTEKVIPSKSRM
ncbi:MAG TPA: hypothetical protein QF753_18215 [Victivallales bacterium]|nr:hypothetical protein [Victivallales bacterium]